jgi:hypothetical protein
MTNLKTKEEVIKVLVEEFGEKESSFYNTETNKQRENFWTFNRLLKYLRNKRIAHNQTN